MTSLEHDFNSDGEQINGLDSDSSEGNGNGKRFQDLVIKFSNLRTLLEPGGGRMGSAKDGDVCHKIG